jgi:asparagine synthase (glutamine-hydrolysing)
MDRFIAFSWRADAEAAAEQVGRWTRDVVSLSPAWVKVLDCPGLRVLLLRGPDNTHRKTQMRGAEGVILGTLFERGHERAGRLDVLEPATAARVMASDGEALLSDYWGSYVAFWRAAPSHPLTVINDPCGATQCFLLRLPGIDVFCSCVSDIAALPGISLSPDWRVIRNFLLNSHTVTPQTGLSEVRELLPGERVKLKPDAEQDYSWAWSPVRIAGSPRRLEFPEAASRLREVADNCLAAWGGACRNIIVRISGGLDSTIVAHRLRQACPGKVTGLHIVGRGYESYERKLARLAAEHAGIELLELDLVPAALADTLTRAPKLVRPSRQVLGMSADALLQQACDALGATAVMGGHGGDSLLLQRSLAVNIFTDFVRDKGLGSGFWQHAYETSMLLEQPVWTTLREAAGNGLFGARRKHHAARPLPAGQDLFPAASSDMNCEAGMPHAWGHDAHRLPPAKAEQLRNIVALHNYQAVMGHGIISDAVHPLISQPIVEFALQTPAYMFSRHGIDRALEREAFADALPDAIARRMHKGFINHQLLSDMSADATFLRAFLLDGRVISHTGVDRSQVEYLLSDEHLVQGGRLDPLMSLIAAEAWATAWR